MRLRVVDRVGVSASFRQCHEQETGRLCETDSIVASNEIAHDDGGGALTTIVA
jgi:hypothetical protein